ncbi:methylmalonyl Co-A mutase-associated GTPase MeaB [soil metagenome]
MDAESLVARALAGEGSAVARLISLVEDGGDKLAEIISMLHGHTGRAYSVGITGAPGAGKSTLTERLVARVRRDDRTVGVLAIDPSSPFSGGALLGDRVRMQSHATDPEVFIRSMATRGHLGGLSLATPEAMRVLDASGKDLVFVETVGVGQAEVEIADACDTTIVVVTPGWGDAVQVAKAGLLEVADVFVVNKADRDGADETARELRHMLGLADAEWKPEIVPTVATKGEGIDDLWEAVVRHRRHQDEDGRLAERRGRRTRDEICDIIAGRCRRRAEEEGKDLLDELVQEVQERRLDPYGAADRVMAALGERRDD